jgi:hypothetical protein
MVARITFRRWSASSGTLDPMRSPKGGETAGVLARLGSLPQYQQGGQRSPHKPLLVLLALGA